MLANATLPCLSRATLGSVSSALEMVGMTETWSKLPKSVHAWCYDCMSWTTIFLPSPLSSLCVVATSFCGLHTSFSPYLLHASPLLLLYCLCVHQYLLIHGLCAPFIPASPHGYLMYQCTISACFRPLPHVYYHTPYACLSSISTG